MSTDVNSAMMRCPAADPPIQTVNALLHGISRRLAALGNGEISGPAHAAIMELFHPLDTVVREMRKTTKPSYGIVHGATSRAVQRCPPTTSKGTIL